MRTYPSGIIASENITIRAMERLSGPQRGIQRIELIRDNHDNILSISIDEAEDLVQYIQSAIRFLQQEQS